MFFDMIFQEKSTGNADGFLMFYVNRYRYGFNGMEKDDEVKGSGNSYTTEFRQYDSRLGRWLSIDPMMSKYPHQSPYAAYNNNPVYFIDPYGLEGVGEPLNPETDNQNSNDGGPVDSYYVGKGNVILYVRDKQDKGIDIDKIKKKNPGWDWVLVDNIEDGYNWLKSKYGNDMDAGMIKNLAFKAHGSKGYIWLQNDGQLYEYPEAEGGGYGDFVNVTMLGPTPGEGIVEDNGEQVTATQKDVEKSWETIRKIGTLLDRDAKVYLSSCDYAEDEEGVNSALKFASFMAGGNKASFYFNTGSGERGYATEGGTMNYLVNNVSNIKSKDKPMIKVNTVWGVSAVVKRNLDLHFTTGGLKEVEVNSGTSIDTENKIEN